MDPADLLAATKAFFICTSRISFGEALPLHYLNREDFEKRAA